ncbi:MAG: response regulator transcription factor [Bacteroidota bacterium]|nr:response regulator transcription factor [Bacteroidota bacterium]MDX5404840.1 response regulator transcription factor [Bacteroidota bacterium]MDX5429103.1 response regulator transcription factor [Bacteroidota bacterium]MDX5448818.1 response regulator transcription factor [Bacteroidota bacterium]MDX5506752.1 response regulator transcription factor [Bacteroidota bacterium]
MGQVINVFIADDHAVIRKGLQLFIEQDEGLKLTGEAADGEELLMKLKRTPVDVLLLDIDMPKGNGIAMIKTIHQKFPGIKIVILSMHPEEIYGPTARKLGVVGYLSKGLDPVEIFRAVKRIYGGETFFNPDLYKKSKKGRVLSIKLSKRESEVLSLISSGMTNKDISEHLDISDKTVSTYKLRLMKKLGARNVVDLVQYYQRFKEGK